MSLADLIKAKWGAGTGKQVVLKDDFKDIEEAAIELDLAMRISRSILKYVDSDEFKVSFPFTPPGAAAWTDVTLKLALAAGGGQLKAGDAVTAHEFYVIYIANTVVTQPIASNFVIREGQTTAESGHTKVGIIYNSTITNATIRAFGMSRHNKYTWIDGVDLTPVSGGTSQTFADVDLDPAVGSTRYAPSTARSATISGLYSTLDPSNTARWAKVRKNGTSGNGKVLVRVRAGVGNAYLTVQSAEMEIELVDGVFEYLVTEAANDTLSIYVYGFVDTDSLAVSD